MSGEGTELGLRAPEYRLLSLPESSAASGPDVSLSAPADGPTRLLRPEAVPPDPRRRAPGCRSPGRCQDDPM